MLLRTIRASLLVSMLADKLVIRGGERVIRADEDEDF